MNIQMQPDGNWLSRGKLCLKYPDNFFKVVGKPQTDIELTREHTVSDGSRAKLKIVSPLE